jgi:hypothetical protein
MRKTIQAIVILTLTLTLLNCITSREVQDAYSEGAYPSWHPTHKK